LSDEAPGLLRMTGPLVVSFWMRALFSFVDTYYASFLGDASVAAIGLSYPFEFVMIAVWVGLSTGLTSTFSRAMGAREEAKLQQYLRATGRLVILCTPAFTLAGASCWAFSRRIAPDADVAREFAIFGTTLIAGSAFTMFWSVIPDSIVKAHGDTRATMWAGIWSNVLNVLFNTLFTFVFHWGIFGIAFSTVLGRFGGLVYALRKAAAHERARKERGEPAVPGLDAHPYRAIFALAVPGALSYVFMAGETGIVNTLLGAVEHGREALAAYAVYYRVFSFVVMPAIAASVAMLPFAARRFGARDVPGVRAGLRAAHTAGFAYVAVAAPILFFTAEPLARQLTASSMTLSFLVPALRFIPVGALIAMPFFLCRPVFEGLGLGRPGLMISILRYALLAAPAAWWGVRLAEARAISPVLGVAFGVSLASVVSSAAMLVWTRAILSRAAVSSRTA
jgi:Na+-driven multidrug efflux pump